MKDVEIRLATCPHGHTFPIPLSKSLLEESGQIQTGMDIPSVYLACSVCGRVYSTPLQEMKNLSQVELSLHLPDGASLYVFVTPIPCDEHSCEFRLQVNAVRRSDTSVEYEKEAPRGWKWAKGQNTKCPFEHDIPLPPWGWG